LVILVVSVTWAGLIWGCGKKGPPVPPQRYRPAAVTDLSYELTDTQVLLAWTIPHPSDRQASRIAGCTVYRAQRALADGDCIDCNASFQKAADVAVPKSAPGETRQQRLGFGDTLTPGFDYAYRVICSTAAGASGNKSNVVRFEYPQPTTQQP
jgi:hypothetical protein